MPKFPRISWRSALLLCAVLLVVGAIALRFAFFAYLGSAGFYRTISTSVSRVLKADGAFMPLHYADGMFYSDGFAARGHADAFFSELKADQIRALFNWRGLWNRRWQIDEVAIQQVDVRFAQHVPARGNEPPPGLAERPVRTPSGWKLDLRKATIAQSNWSWRQDPANEGKITGSSFVLTPSGDSWLIDASGGRITQAGWPELLLDSARLRYNGSSLFVSESAFRTGVGKISVNGEVKFRDAADLQAQFTEMPLQPLLASDWRARLTGRLSGSAKIHAPFNDNPAHVEGSLHLSEGQIEALPLLDQIATFTRTERFRRMLLSKASLSFSRDGQLVTAKDVIVESEGLMRLEGAFTILNGQIDGLFQLGVTSSSLQWLPGSQTRVFTIPRDGYLWTPLRLTGPVAHPKEDLSARLVAAAAGELLQNSQDTVIDAAKSLLDLVPH